MGVKNAQKAVEWTARMAAFEASGQRRRVWCAAQGLNVNTFAYWHRRLCDLAAASRQEATSRSGTAKSPRSPVPRHRAGAGADPPVGVNAVGVVAD